MKIGKQMMGWTLNGKEPDTSRIFLRGAGGTGKSTVVDRITTLFKNTGHISWLRKVAYTGKAAVGIDGCMTSSLIHERRGLNHRLTEAHKLTLIA